MTREMYEKCLNRGMVILAGLPEDVRTAIQTAERRQYYTTLGRWEDDTGYSAPSMACRIHPDTPIDEEFEEVAVKEIKIGQRRLYALDGIYTMSACLTAINCLGIIYELNGVETLRTSVDLAFGTPKRVRFRK